MASTMLHQNAYQINHLCYKIKFGDISYFDFNVIKSSDNSVVNLNKSLTYHSHMYIYVQRVVNGVLLV